MNLLIWQAIKNDIRQKERRLLGRRQMFPPILI